MHGLTTYYFGAAQAPLDEPILLARRRPARDRRQHGGDQQRRPDVRPAPAGT